MTVNRDPDYLISLMHELRKLPKETERTEKGQGLKMGFCKVNLN